MKTCQILKSIFKQNHFAYRACERCRNSDRLVDAKWNQASLCQQVCFQVVSALINSVCSGFRELTKRLQNMLENATRISFASLHIDANTILIDFVTYREHLFVTQFVLSS
jgi:hypothetical protein